MKNFKKALSILISLVFIFSAFSFIVRATGEEEITTQFKDGKFKILVYSDIHYASQDGAMLEDQISFFEASLDHVKPDLVVFNGDNVTAKTVESQRQSIETIMAPIIERDLYFALTFGNHDAEQPNGMSRKEQFEVYMEYEKCLAVKGPEDIHGVGNFNILLKNDDDQAKFNLWFIDSNDYDSETGGYGYVTDSQIEWYEGVSAALAEENGGQPLPSVLFQHICVPEMYDLLVPSLLPKPYSVLGHRTYSNRFWSLDPNNPTIEGGLWEPPCPPDTNNGQFDSWKKMGDVKLAIFGHDHSNTYSGELDGIRLMFCGLAGMAPYGNGANYQASLITIDEETQTAKRDHIKFADVVGPKLKHFSFFDYFEQECWHALLRLNPMPLIKSFKLAIKATFMA